MSAEVKQLPTVISSDGFELRQVMRTGDVAIYSKRKIDPKYEAGYEVIRIRIDRAKEINGYSYPDREVYPSSEEWGLHGWTYRTIQGANDRARMLTGNADLFPDPSPDDPAPKPVAAYEKVSTRRESHRKRTVSCSGNSPTGAFDCFSGAPHQKSTKGLENVFPGASTTKQPSPKKKESKCCSYCGGPNQCRDHVIPVAYSSVKRSYASGTVPCCTECNSLLGDKPILTVRERAEYLIKAYLKENSSVLSFYYDPDRFQEMGYTFQVEIRNRLARKDLVQAKLLNLILVSDGCEPVAIQYNPGSPAQEVAQ